MRCALLVLLLSGMPVVWSQTSGIPAHSWELIRACSERADTDAIGVSEIELACPGLRAALAESGYASFLSASQQEQLSVHSLVELQQLAKRYDENADDGEPLRTQTLDTILASMQRESAERAPTWWERIEQWLRKLLDDRQDQDLTWLAEWFEKLSISESVVRVTLYALVGLVIALAIAIVVNEMRAAGLLGRRRAGRQAVSKTNREREKERAAIDWDRLSPRDRVSALLQILVSTLVATGRLRAERSLTYRELSSQASFRDGAQRACFERIALSAERLVYGRGELASEQLERLVQDARQLQARLAEDLR